MQRTKIEWTDYVWNPIKGLCPIDCKLPDGRSYCYARKIYQRFGWNPKVRFKLLESLENIIYKNKETTFGENIKFRPQSRIKENSKIFICSTFELFHPIVKKEWRDKIFETIELNPKHTFQILTKFPQNIDRPMPDNVWLGVSVTKADDDGWRRLYYLATTEAKIKFVSFEPLLGKLNTSLLANVTEDFDWFIIGRLTGHGKKYDPDISWIKDIVTACADSDVKVFLKNNLKDIWGENLIQEMPQIG